MEVRLDLRRLYSAKSKLGGTAYDTSGSILAAVYRFKHEDHALLIGGMCCRSRRDWTPPSCHQNGLDVPVPAHSVIFF